MAPLLRPGALVSTDSDWTQLDQVAIPAPAPTGLAWMHFFTVNRAGIALIPSFLDACWNSCRGGDDIGPVLDTIDFSADLENWTTIESLDD